ncbi:MAG TPA: hypothetical protein PKY35_03465 [Candidatus Hydrogenedentes bacterium]|nr:hypothetical protein [Candidatus Hydrogenedentota bacterium]HOL76063.1 hypothetical protein [Candidatus Hydrogenedentota bacterium]HPO84677.1 hypothetical protein [Candidatus Hydrogenedentota bacterium]
MARKKKTDSTDLSDLVFDPTCVGKGTRVWVCSFSATIPARGGGGAYFPPCTGDVEGAHSFPTEVCAVHKCGRGTTVFAVDYPYFQMS